MQISKSSLEISRLRLGEKIIGYRKKHFSNYYYSKDLYSWSGEKIDDYNAIDFSTGIKDKNDTILFSEDIIMVQNKENDTQYLHVIWDEFINQFLYVDFQEQELAYNESELLKKFQKSNLQKISYAFLN